jgi:hypothetical protein
MGLLMIAWEYPLGFVAGSGIHRSLEARLAALPLFALAAVLTYQGANAGLYYVVAMVVYFWAYSEGEVRLANTIFNSSEHSKANPFIRWSVQSPGLCRKEAPEARHSRATTFCSSCMAHHRLFLCHAVSRPTIPKRRVRRGPYIRAPIFAFKE